MEREKGSRKKEKCKKRNNRGEKYSLPRRLDSERIKYLFVRTYTHNCFFKIIYVLIMKRSRSVYWK